MPLIKGPKSTKQGFQSNVRKELKAGKPLKQSLAIAYSQSNKSNKSTKLAKRPKKKPCSC